MPAAAQPVPSEIVAKWQQIVNLLAEIIQVPAALVMQAEPPNIKVFVSSESALKPVVICKVSTFASINTGLYCRDRHEEIRQPLSIPDALSADEEWQSNPDIELGA